MVNAGRLYTIGTSWGKDHSLAKTTYSWYCVKHPEKGARLRLASSLRWDKAATVAVKLEMLGGKKAQEYQSLMFEQLQTWCEHCLQTDPRKEHPVTQGTGSVGDRDARERNNQAAPVSFMDSSRGGPGS